MTQETSIAFGKHLVKRLRKGHRVKIPAMTGAGLDNLLRALERAHGYAQ